MNITSVRFIKNGFKAYLYYSERRAEIDARAGEVSAHSRPAAMGVIRLLKWLS